MKTPLIILLISLLSWNLIAQVSFSPVDSKLQTLTGSSELTCSGSGTTVRFPIKREVTVLSQNTLAKIDQQNIQIMFLKFDGNQKNPTEGNLDNQKQLLDAYSNYELDYFRNTLGIEIINPKNQWVISKSKGWFIWYFRVGNIPTQVENQTEIQLFSTTVIGDKILIINAPITTGGDFSKAATIVNELMEGLVVLQ